LIKSFVGYDDNVLSEVEQTQSGDDSAFARRLITGLAAEQYFESVQAGLPQFSGCTMENTTRYGCGYDFRFRSEPKQKEFLAVEVKGLRAQTGSLSLTPREFEAASELRGRFFLFVVKNFQKLPFHEIFQDPLSCGLQFRKTQRTIVQVSWLANV
jgi:hypothetical protein